MVRSDGQVESCVNWKVNQLNTTEAWLDSASVLLLGK